MTVASTELFRTSLIPSLGEVIADPELVRTINGRTIAGELAADSLSDVTRIVVSELLVDPLSIKESFHNINDSYPREGIYPNLDGHVFCRRLAGLQVARDLLMPEVIHKLGLSITPESLVNILSERQVTFSRSSKTVTLDMALFSWLTKVVIDNVEDDAFPIQSREHKESGSQFISSMIDKGVDMRALFSGNQLFYTRTVTIKGPSDPYPHFTTSQEETWIHLANKQGFEFTRIPHLSSHSDPPIYAKIPLPNTKAERLSQFLYNFSAPDDAFSIVTPDTSRVIMKSFEAFELEERAKKHVTSLDKQYGRNQ